MKKLVSGLILAAGAPLGALAQAPNILPRAGTPGVPTTGTGLINLIQTFSDWIFTGLLLIVIFIVLWAAFQFLTSGGNPDAVASARNKLLFAAIGIVVAMFALVFDDIIRNIVGI